MQPLNLAQWPAGWSVDWAWNGIEALNSTVNTAKSPLLREA